MKWVGKIGHELVFIDVQFNVVVYHPRRVKNDTVNWRHFSGEKISSRERIIVQEKRQIVL